MHAILLDRRSVLIAVTIFVTVHVLLLAGGYAIGTRLGPVLARWELHAATSQTDGELTPKSDSAVAPASDSAATPKPVPSTNASGSTTAPPLGHEQTSPTLVVERLMPAPVATSDVETASRSATTAENDPSITSPAFAESPGPRLRITEVKSPAAPEPTTTNVPIDRASPRAADLVTPSSVEPMSQSTETPRKQPAYAASPTAGAVTGSETAFESTTKGRYAPWNATNDAEHSASQEADRGAANAVPFTAPTDSPRQPAPIYTVEVATYANESKAQSRFEKLSAAGYRLHIQATVDRRARPRTTIHLGPFADKQSALDAATSFAAREGTPAIVREVDADASSPD